MIACRRATVEDAPGVAAIYAPFVAETAITFETETVSPAEMAERITQGGDLYPWFVAESEAEGILGFAYSARFHRRSAYRFAVETTVYVDPRAFRRGIGGRLCRLVLDTASAQGFTQAIAAIALPNQPSVALHEKLGFDPVGTYRRVGYKLGAWHDVGLWQRELAAPAQPPAEPVAVQPR